MKKEADEPRQFKCQKNGASETTKKASAASSVLCCGFPCYLRKMSFSSLVINFGYLNMPLCGGVYLYLIYALLIIC